MIPPSLRRVLVTLTACACLGPAAAADAQSLPSWRAGRAAGQMIEIPGSGIASLGTAKVSGAVWRYIHLSWAGYAFAPDGRVFSFANGGHDVWDNAFAELDLAADTPRWLIKRPSAPFSDVVRDGAYYRDGTPASGHNYYSVKWVEQRNRVMRVGAPAKYPFGFSDIKPLYGWDAASERYDPAGTWADNPIGTQSPVWAVAADPRTGDLYTFNTSGVAAVWTQAANTWERIPSEIIHWTPSAIDTRRNRLVAIGLATNTLLFMDLATRRWTKESVTGEGVAAVAYAELGYDDGTDKYHLFWFDQSPRLRIYEIDPDTLVGAMVYESTDPKLRMVNGAAGKIGFVKSLGGYALLPTGPTGTSNAHFWVTTAEPAPPPDTSRRRSRPRPATAK